MPVSAPSCAMIALPERHLGLVQAQEFADIDQLWTGLPIHRRCLDVDAIRRSARPRDLRLLDERSDDRFPLPPPGQRIALAQDRAFSFMYPHLLRQWRARARRLFRSRPWPMRRPMLPPTPSGCLEDIRSSMLARSHQPMFFVTGFGNWPVARFHPWRVRRLYGAGAGIEDAGGVRHGMTGLLALETSFSKRKLHLGYRRARLKQDCSLGAEGAEVFGHEYHYANTFRSMAIRWSIAGTRPGPACPSKACGTVRRRGLFFMLSTGRPHDRDAPCIAATIRPDVSRDVPGSHSLASRRPPLSPGSDRSRIDAFAA